MLEALLPATEGGAFEALLPAMDGGGRGLAGRGDRTNPGDFALAKSLRAKERRLGGVAGGGDAGAADREPDMRRRAPGRMAGPPIEREHPKHKGLWRCM